MIIFEVWIMRDNTNSRVSNKCPECGSGKFFTVSDRSYCGGCGYYC